MKMCPFRKVQTKQTRKQYQNAGFTGIGDPTLLANMNEPINMETVSEDFMPCLLEDCPLYKPNDKNFCSKTL